MAFLTDDELNEVVRGVFQTKEMTLEGAAANHSLQDLVQTVQRMRHQMNNAVDALPPHAFEPQPDDADGNEVWNAGQIVSHIIGSQVRLTGNIGSLVEYTLEQDVSELAPKEDLDMSGTRSAIKFATKALTSTLKAIPEDADLSKTVDAGMFGELGVRGWLMLTAVHEMDHVQQLNSLA